ncbi:CYTH domain-containing protein [Paenibacillus shenyangensis]|uniref:hypothetical protein n=1 Tax=Paenibacillus sp. A9 TaxID=1284352 RepID=UPI000374D32E|nr:hypothetical protein [Paenibacillus sp. A9]
MNNNVLKNWKKTVAVWVSSTVMAGSFIMIQPSTPVEAAANMTPGYEVKFVLNQNVLDPDSTPDAELTSAFALPGTAQKIAVEYFDTDEQSLNEQGWNVRLRKKEDKKNYEITYKKRYAVANGDINAALNLANKEGFDADDTNYEAEIDWGYSKQTLSLSNDKDVKASDSKATLPSDSKALGMILDKLPGKLDDWNDQSHWGKQQMEDSRAYGPIMASKYKGTWNGLEVDVEVWPIRSADGSTTEPVIEISFKADEYADAATNRQKLMDYLNKEGWLVPQDSLKTQLVLDRY